MKEVILEVKNLCYSYQNRKDIALENINFKVNKGDKVAFIGPNGAGKTTLFLHLSGILKCSVNTIFIDNKDLNFLNLKERVSKISILFSDPEIQLVMPTVYDDIAFGPSNLGLSETEIKKRVEEAIKITNLEHLKNRVSQHLSTGQKKKVALASIISLKPEILILDEPTANLDPKSKKEIINIINFLNEQGMTIIIATHDLNILSEVSNIVYIINKKIVFYGKAHEIFNRDDILIENNLEAPDIYKFFKILQKMNLYVQQLPLNFKEAVQQLQKNIKNQTGIIKLYYNKSIVSFILNLIFK